MPLNRGKQNGSPERHSWKGGTATPRQFRNRGSGRAIASTPPELVPAEAMLRSEGSAGGVSAAFLDRALRRLASWCATSGVPLPDVAAARLGVDTLDLLLSPAAVDLPPRPWRADEGGARWTLPRDARVEPCDAVAPYPTLVAVGVAHDDATWLLDLEAANLVYLRGDRGACQDLARFMAAELALNVWSDEIDVSLAGLDEELVTLNPARLRHQEAPDVAALAKAMRRAREATETTGLAVLAGRVEGRGVDSWTPTILINGSASASQQFRGDVERLIEDLAGGPGRVPIALVALEAEPTASSGTTISLDSDRRFTLQPWGVPLVANRLTTEDARTLAALLDDRDTADRPMPATSGSQPSDHLSDEAGALRVELTEPRVEAGTSGSLLPLPDAAYVASTATTTADLAALSPSVPARTRESVLAVDPSLDDEVADWYDPRTHRPRLRLSVLSKCGRPENAHQTWTTGSPTSPRSLPISRAGPTAPPPSR